MVVKYSQCSVSQDTLNTEMMLGIHQLTDYRFLSWASSISGFVWRRSKEGAFQISDIFSSVIVWSGKTWISNYYREGWGREGSDHPDSHALIWWLSALCFIFIAKVYAILLNILPGSCPSRLQYTSHPPVTHHITLRYWELLLKSGKKVFIHKQVSNV